MNNLFVFIAGALLLTSLSVNVYAQWTRTDPLCSGNVNCVASANGFLFAGTRNGLYRSSDQGIHWNRSDSGITVKEITAFGTLWSTLVAGTSTGGVFISGNNGETWRSASGGLSISNITAFAVSPDKAVGAPALYACFHDTLYGGTVYRTVDTGAHWTPVSNGITNGDARSLVFCGNDLYAGTMGGVFLSTNAGIDWAPKNTGLTVPYVVALLACDSLLFAGTMTGGAFRSTDRGAHWEQINNGLTNTYVNDLTATTAGAIFAGTGWNGVYVTTDNGTQWKQANTGLTTFQVNALAVDGEQRTLFAATDDGVWVRPVSEMLTAVPVNDVRMPETIELYQNYPNPFNPSTTIRYTLPSSAHVILTIHDLLGREIATLVNEDQTSGWKEVVWDAAQIANGIYFYRLTTENIVEIKKMILLK
jgi:ligand-binding sensor domain-containing protein